MCGRSEMWRDGGTRRSLSVTASRGARGVSSCRPPSSSRRAARSKYTSMSPVRVAICNGGEAKEGVCGAMRMGWLLAAFPGLVRLERRMDSTAPMLTLMKSEEPGRPSFPNSAWTIAAKKAPRSSGAQSLVGYECGGERKIQFNLLPWLCLS